MAVLLFSSCFFFLLDGSGSLGPWSAAGTTALLWIEFIRAVQWIAGNCVRYRSNLASFLSLLCLPLAVPFAVRRLVDNSFKRTLKIDSALFVRSPCPVARAFFSEKERELRSQRFCMRRTRPAIGPTSSKGNKWVAGAERQRLVSIMNSIYF